jgi:tetratricopeptide (TPR) repeat protein
LRALPLSPLNTALQHKALRAYETLAHSHSPQSGLLTLPQAGLLALALRERRRLTGSWKGLPEDLPAEHPDPWLTPLACLYGLVPDPLEFMATLVIQPAHYKLALGILLCQPEAPEVQLEMLGQLSPAQAPLFLRTLASLAPSLAQTLARRGLPDYPSQPTDPDGLAQIAALALDAERYTLAAESDTAHLHLSAAQNAARKLQASLAAQQALIAETAEAALAAWRLAVDLAPEIAHHQARLMLALVDAEQIDDADHLRQTCLPDPQAIPDDALWLLAEAQLAVGRGQMARARQLAGRCLQTLEENLHPIEHQPLSIIPFTMPCNWRTVADGHRLARLLLDLGEPAQAARAAQLTAEADPTRPDLLALLGHAQASAGQTELAISTCQIAVLLAPEKIDLRRQLATNLEAAQRWSEALEEWVKIAKTATPQPADLHALARCALRANQPQLTVETCRQLLQSNSEDGQAHALLGQALTRQGESQAALQHFTLATQWAPQLPEPWLALAHALQASGQPQAARETLQAGAQAVPRAAEIYLALGEACLLSDSPTQALEAFRHAAEFAPQDAHIVLRLGQTLIQLGHLAQAAEVLESASQENHARPDLAYAYAQTLLALGQASAAIQPLLQVLACNPDQTGPYIDYADAILQADPGQAHKAVAALRQALKRQPNSPEARALLAEALMAAGDLQAALPAFQAALDTPLAQVPTWQARLSYGLGRVALFLGQTDTAIAALQEATQADPSRLNAYYLLAQAYQCAQLDQSALNAAQTARRLAPEEVDNLLWYADTLLALSRQAAIAPAGTSKDAASQRQSEALEALAQAARLAPQRADILLRLADIQHSAGNDVQAAETLRRVKDVSAVSLDELRQATQNLLDPLHDTPGAIACLKRAVAICRASDDPVTSAKLLLELAKVHQLNAEPELAFEAVSEALALAPDDPGLHGAKASLLLKLGPPETALSCLTEALARFPTSADLHLQTALILRSLGQLTKAMEHAEQADRCPGAGALAALLKAELLQANLQPEAARASLNQVSAPVNLDATCLNAELALEAGEEINAAALLSQALELFQTDSAHFHPRLLAIQSRLALRRGDAETARHLFHTALDISKAASSANSNGRFAKGNPPVIPSPALPLALAEAGAELGDWEVALRQSQLAVELTPHEALNHLTLARVLVQRAEYQRLCAAAEVIVHAPGVAAVSEEAFQQFEQAIRTAKKLNKAAGQSRDSQVAEQPASGLAVNCQRSPIAHWRARGLFAFHNPQPPADLVASTPIQPISHFLRARQAHQNGDLQAAYTNIQIALAHWPDEPRWHTLAADVFAGYGKSTERIEHLEKAVQLEPKHLAHYLALGQAILEDNDQPTQLQSAARVYERACGLAPDQAEPWLALARVHLQASQQEQASVCIARASELAPANPEPLRLKAEIALQAGETQAAQEYACAALRLQPDDPQTALMLSRTLQANHHLTEALQVVEKALANTSSRALQLERLRLLDQVQGAQVALQNAIDLAGRYPQDPTILNVLARLQAEAGEVEAAIQTARAGLQSLERPNGHDPHPSPRPAQLHHLIGTLLNRQGQLDQAIHHLDEAIRLSPDWVDPYLELGYTLQNRRQHRQALQTYQSAIRAVPSDHRPYLCAALALKDAKDYTGCESFLRRAAELAPNDVSIRRQLAAVVAINLVHSRRRVAPGPTDETRPASV